MAKQTRRPSPHVPKPHPVTQKVASKVVPSRRSFLLLETGLLIGLAEGILTNLIHTLPINAYLKALLVMIGIIGVFAIAIRVLEPIIAWMLKMISSLDRGGGPLLRLGLHAIILFLIFVAYVRIFFQVH